MTKIAKWSLVLLAVIVAAGWSGQTGWAGPEAVMAMGQAKTETAGGGIAGTWDSVAVTPNGDLPVLLELKMNGDQLSGELQSEMGALPIQSISFKDNLLQFEVTLNSGTYRIQAKLEGDKLTGGWGPASGGEGGAWRAARRAPAPAAKPAAASAPAAIVGTWNAVASTPEGNLAFQVEIKQNGSALTGAMVTPGGSIPLQKPEITGDKLAFLVDYQGGTYRVEMTLAGEKLAGKWTSVDGSDTGAINAERKKP
jgi:hypothetical protein